MTRRAPEEHKKRDWEKPEFRRLKFNQTYGGRTTGEFEGFPWDGSIY